MKKIFMLSSLLLLSAVCAIAQYGSQDTSSQTNTNQTSASSSSEMTVQGCLSGTDGSYMLTDKSGTMYQIKGNTSALQAHVGHTVSVTGTSTRSAASQSNSMSSPSDSHPTLTVSSFKHVSPTCSSAAQ